MGGGGAPPGQLATYPTKVTEWSDVLLTTSTPTLTFSLLEAMEYAKAFNPWSGRSAFNPSGILEDLEADVEEFTAAAKLVSASDVDSYIESASDLYDTQVGSETKISELVEAHDVATQANYQRRVSRFNVGMWQQGAYMTTQFGVGGMLIAAERGGELAELRARLDVQNFGARAQGVIQLAQLMSQRSLSGLQAKQSAVSGRMDFLKASMLSTDDYTDKMIEYGYRERTYDMSLLNDGTAQVMAILGSQLVPRALTPGERAVSQIGTAINTALQFSAATNPVAGALAGIASLGISAIGSAIDGRAR